LLQRTIETTNTDHCSDDDDTGDYDRKNNSDVTSDNSDRNWCIDDYSFDDASDDSNDDDGTSGSTNNNTDGTNDDSGYNTNYNFTDTGHNDG